MIMTYIGIDPGKKGGIAVLIGTKTAVFPYTDEKMTECCKRFSGAANVICFVEKVHSMPGQGVSSMFSFGRSYGYILGALEASGIAYQEVSPQRWKRHYGLGADKQQAIAMAKKLFPGISLRPSERCTKDSDGMAEALLIARYGKRMDGYEE